MTIRAPTWQETEANNSRRFQQEVAASNRPVDDGGGSVPAGYQSGMPIRRPVMGQGGGNMNMNALKGWMDFYEKEGIGGNLRGARDISGKNPFDMKGMAADWAMGMMGGAGGGGEPPTNYFADQQRRELPAYVQPQQFAPQGPPQYQYGIRPQGLSGQPLEQEMAQRPQQGQGIQNYLAQLLRRGR